MRDKDDFINRLSESKTKIISIALSRDKGEIRTVDSMVNVFDTKTLT